MEQNKKNKIEKQQQSYIIQQQMEIQLNKHIIDNEIEIQAARDMEDPDILEIARAEARLEDITDTVNDIDKQIQKLVTQRKPLVDEKARIIATLKKKMKEITDLTKKCSKIGKMDISWNNNYIDSQKDILDEHHIEGGEYSSESEFDEDLEEFRSKTEELIGINSSFTQASYCNDSNSSKNHFSNTAPTMNLSQSIDSRINSHRDKQDIISKDLNNKDSKHGKKLHEMEKYKRLGYQEFLYNTREYLDTFIGTKAYSIELKQKIMYFAEIVGMKKVSRDIGISYENIKKWKKKLRQSGTLERKNKARDCEEM